MPKKVKTNLVVELSFDEKLENSYKEAKRTHKVAVPAPAYLYKVGQFVQYGQLIDVQVEKVLEDGKYLAISHHQKGKEYGAPYDNGRKFFAVKAWYDLAPVPEMPVNNLMAPRKNYNFLSFCIQDLLNTLERSGIQDSPDYQRGYVWSEDDKAKFIHSIMMRSDLGKIVLVELPYTESAYYEILDGKQRINALRDFIAGKFKYQNHFHWELSRLDRSEIENSLITVAKIKSGQLTKVEKLELFLSVNAAGVPQTEEHLSHVRRLLQQAKQEEVLTAIEHLSHERGLRQQAEQDEGLTAINKS